MLPCMSQLHSSSIKTRSDQAISQRKLASGLQHKSQEKMTDSPWLSQSGTSGRGLAGEPRPQGTCCAVCTTTTHVRLRALDWSAGEVCVVHTGSPTDSHGAFTYSPLPGLSGKNPCRNSDHVSLFQENPSSHLSHLSVHHRPGCSKPHHPASMLHIMREFIFACDCYVHPRVLFIFLNLF